MRGVRRKGNVKSASQSEGVAYLGSASAQQRLPRLAKALRCLDLQGNGEELRGVGRYAMAKQGGAMHGRGLAMRWRGTESQNLAAA